MLIAIIGKDYEARLALRKEAAKGKPLEVIEQGDTLVSELLEKASHTPLFGGKTAYLVRVLEDAEGLEDAYPALAESPNLFLFEGEELLKETRSAIETAGGEVREAKKGVSKERPFNLFALADALMKRDRKNLWLLLMKALRQGYEPEEIAGVLHWSARTLCAASRAQSASEASMKEFTYAKAKRGAANFTGEELAALSRTLVTLYHEGHRGDDMALLLERFALTL